MEKKEGDAKDGDGAKMTVIIVKMTMMAAAACRFRECDWVEEDGEKDG